MRGRGALVGVVLLLAACGGDDADPGPSAEVTTTTTAEQPVEAEVEAAYLRFWDVYAHALRTFDESRLHEVLTGEALQRVRDEVARLRGANTPVRMEVEHSYSIEVDGERAVVTDRYVNHAVLLDGEGRPTEPDPNERLHEEWTLTREGAWRVASGRRY